MPDQLVLGIETSCDETALALLKNGELLDQVLSSQADLHAVFGGVVPELASREHCRFLPSLFDQIVARNGISPENINLIAVARGPGLLGSLLVGGAFAKALAFGLQCPVLGVNHLHAHLLANGLTQKLVYPAIGLLVSGGHTHLYRINSPEEFITLGRSLDDAAGEIFDKIGNALGLPYPAGSQVDELGRKGSSENWTLPAPYLFNDNLDFSFSGLKTAAVTLIQKQGLENMDAARNREDFCGCLNETVSRILVEKTRRAFDRVKEARALWIAGGVAANSFLRKDLALLAEEKGVEFLSPPLSLCTDNGAMIAYAGWLLSQRGCRHGMDFMIYPRGQIIPDDFERSRINP